MSRCIFQLDGRCTHDSAVKVKLRNPFNKYPFCPFFGDEERCKRFEKSTVWSKKDRRRWDEMAEKSTNQEG